MDNNDGNGKGLLTREERLQIMLSPEELAVVDDFRFKQRMPSRAAAVRELLRLGLGAVGLSPAEAGTKSGDFGVLGTGPHSHLPTSQEALQEELPPPSPPPKGKAR